MNVAVDGTFDGDQPSNPGSAPRTAGAETYRGEGHINVTGAVERVRSARDNR